MINNAAQLHPSAIVEDGATIGADTKVWAFTHILPGAEIGIDCNICDMVFIENDVRIGDRVTIKSGVQLWDGIRIDDDVFIGPNVTFTNDKFPRSKHYPEHFLETAVHNKASIGANATILPGIEIGVGAMVGAGAVVTVNVPAGAVVVGNPARIVAYSNTEEKQVRVNNINKQLEQSKIDGVQLYEIQHVKDMRGDLSAIEWQRDLPFTAKRAFFVHNVPSSRVRGEHAHKECHQFLLCVCGSISVIVDNGEIREEFILDKSYIGIYIPPGVWGIQYKYSSDAVLLVLASHEYDTMDYIRDYEEFLNYLKL